MNRNLSPKTMRRAAFRTVWASVGYAVDRAVTGAVDQALDLAVYWAVYRAAFGALQWTTFVTVARTARDGPPHPNLDRLVAEIRQPR